jgi:hypothetical protein
VEHELFEKAASTFPDHAFWCSMICSEDLTCSEDFICSEDLISSEESASTLGIVL